MCTVLLPPGGYPIAVKYIISYIISYIIYPLSDCLSTVTSMLHVRAPPAHNVQHCTTGWLMNWKRGARKWSRPFRALSRNLPKIRKTKKQPSAWVSDILTASLPKRTQARSIWKAKLQLHQLIAGGSGKAFLTSAQHARSPSDADPGSFSPGEIKSLVPFKVGDVSRPPGTISTFRDEENILSFRYSNPDCLVVQPKVQSLHSLS